MQAFNQQPNGLYTIDFAPQAGSSPDSVVVIGPNDEHVATLAECLHGHGFNVAGALIPGDPDRAIGVVTAEIDQRRPEAVVIVHGGEKTAVLARELGRLGLQRFILTINPNVDNAEYGPAIKDAADHSVFGLLLPADAARIIRSSLAKRRAVEQATE